MKEQTLSEKLISEGWNIRHIRLIDPFNFDGQKYERGGVTLLWTYDHNSDILYKFSICNPKDQYSRETGIEIANESVLRMVEFLTAGDAVVDILKDVVRNNELSKEIEYLLFNFMLDNQTKQLKKLFNY